MNFTKDTYVALTDNLKGMIEDYKTRLPVFHYNRLLIDIYQGIQHYKNEFKVIPQGKDRAYNVNRHIDELIEAGKKDHPKEWAAVTCRKGCSACCRKPVMITDDEADLLVECAKEIGLELDVELLEKQAEFDGPPDEYFAQPKEISSCVFLKDNQCMVYEHRPAACRKFFVVSDPAGCHGEPGTQIQVLSDRDIEIVAAGALEVDHSRSGFMADRLLTRLGVRDGRDTNLAAKAEKQLSSQGDPTKLGVGDGDGSKRSRGETQPFGS